MSNNDKINQALKNRNLFKWLLIILFVWAFPSSIIWTSLYLYLNEDCERKDIRSFNQIERKLEEIAHDSSRTRFFENNFQELFKSLKGHPINSSFLQKVIDGFTNGYPKNMLSVYVFNGKLEIIKTKDAPKEFELFLKLASSSPDSETITEEQIQEIGKKIPEPALILKLVRAQKGKAIELGNPDRFSLCYFDYDPLISSQSVGGILIFAHYNELSNNIILSKQITDNQKNNYGFIDYNDIRLPYILKNTKINEDFIKAYYKMNPTNRFRRYSKLVCLKRLSEHCLIIGAEDINQPSWPVYFTIAVLFLILSILFFKITYKAFVSQPNKGLNLRMRIIWLFIICYILPIIVAAILASQYLIELKSYILANEEQKSYKRLSEIDSGFSRFITSKLIEYRKLNEELTNNVENLEYIKDKFKQMCNDCLIDSAHLISSDSQLLLSSALVSSEVRRHKDKPKSEKDKIYETWFNRGAILTEMHRNFIFNEKEAKYYPIDSERTEAHKAFIKVFSSTAASSMEYYNQSKNIITNTFKKKTDMIVNAIVEAHSMGLFQTAKTNISRFTNLEAIKEKILAYLDIIPGPSGEAWYGYVTLTNLDCLERMYLDDIFHDIKVRNNRINRVFSDEDIRAVSAHPYSTCFPSINEYQTFNSTLKQSENDSKSFTHEMTLKGEKCYVSVLKGSYLKHYILLKIIKEKDIELIYKKQVNTVVLIFIIIMIMGLALARLMTKNLVMPISDSLNGVKAFGCKNYDFRIKVRSNNEFGTISKSFNETAEMLKDLNITQELSHYLPWEKDIKCGTYILYPSNTTSNLVPNDFFECLTLKQGTYAIFSASISGNDDESAHLMTMLKAAFLTLMPMYTQNPEIALSKLTKQFEQYIKNQHIINCFIGILDPTNDIITCSNAGQPNPILFDSQRKASEFINLPSTSLGFNSGSKTSYTKHEISLRHKILVLYSHGAIDSVNNSGEEFGKERLLSLVNEKLTSDSANPSEEILKTVSDYSLNLPWREDISIITIQTRI